MVQNLSKVRDSKRSTNGIHFQTLHRWAILAVLCVNLACASNRTETQLTDPRESKPSLQSYAIHPNLNVPADLPSDNNPELGVDWVSVPPALLSLGKICRSRAELRSGPGTEFDLLDFTLEENDKVVIFDTIGVWNKIISVHRGVVGWVHEKTFTHEPNNDGGESIRIKAQRLPRVFAVEHIDTVFTYGAQERVPAQIRRGTSFVALRKLAGRTLVWIPRSDSIFWISQQSVK